MADQVPDVGVRDQLSHQAIDKHQTSKKSPINKVIAEHTDSAFDLFKKEKILWPNIFNFIK